MSVPRVVGIPADRVRYSESMGAAPAGKPAGARLSAVTLTAIALVVLAGCSSKGAGTSSGTTTTGPATHSTVATTIPFSLAKNARQDVTAGSCKKADGAWVLSGTIENSAHTSRSYQIVVDFVNPVGNTVLDTRIVTTARVRPGAGVAWSAKSVSGLPRVACVIRQVQAPA
jgi:hypothetical protein